MPYKKPFGFQNKNYSSQAQGYNKSYSSYDKPRGDFGNGNFRIRSPVKSFRDLEVYQTTIQLSNILTNSEFLKNEKEEIRKVSEEIPKLIAEAYGDKFDSIELSEKKLDEAVTLITDIITKIDLYREKFAEGKEEKEILDKLLVKYGYQKIKVLNLKKAWRRIFEKYRKN